MNPLSALAAALLAGLLLGFGGGWQVQAWRHDANELQHQQQRAQDARKAAAQVDRAAEAFQARQEAADAREADLERRTYAELQKPAGRGACLSPGGLRILADAAAQSNARRRVAPALSAASGAR